MVNEIDGTNSPGPKESATLGQTIESDSAANTVNPPWNPEPAGKFMISLFEAIGKCMSNKSPEVSSILDVTK
jgi:hypothetical protein